MTADRLTVYLASTVEGAFRVGLALNEGHGPVGFFRGMFPTARLTENERINLPLAEGIAAALQGEPSDGRLPMDVSFSPFQSAVLQTVAAIPFGRTRTYGNVALLAGRPGAARAVGQVMGSNPLPLIFP
jgi:O6-methylguanine-DNA--protein-cysteine methyltransferase